MTSQLPTDGRTPGSRTAREPRTRTWQAASPMQASTHGGRIALVRMSPGWMRRGWMRRRWRTRGMGALMSPQRAALRAGSVRIPASAAPTVATNSTMPATDARASFREGPFTDDRGNSWRGLTTAGHVGCPATTCAAAADARVHLSASTSDWQPWGIRWRARTTSPARRRDQLGRRGSSSRRAWPRGGRHRAARRPADWTIEDAPSLPQ
jgi:hypothetical protein